ncbi:hypothetical protein CcaCcLH18_06001 [Colletotrichum camelliae]|nr:hypothetical protein CcaCcLH18_06001 [Colletotrichum camelliae]
MASAFKFDIPLSVRSFAPFPKLPTEIRQQIWEDAIFEPGMHYLRIDTKARSFVSHGSVALGPPDSDDEDDDVLPDFSQERRHGPLVQATLKPRFAAPQANLSNHVTVNQVMATLSVTCSEARAVVQRLASHPRTLKLDDGRVVSLGAADDVVLLEYIPLKTMGAGCRLALNISCTQLASIRRVAVQYCHLWEGTAAGYYCRLCGEHHFGSRKRTYPLHLYEFLARHLPNLEAFYFVDYMILRKSDTVDDDDFDMLMADWDSPQPFPREVATEGTGKSKVADAGAPRKYKSASHLFEEVDEDKWDVRSKVLDTLSWVRKRFNQYATQSKFSKHKQPNKVHFGVLACEWIKNKEEKLVYSTTRTAQNKRRKISEPTEASRSRSLRGTLSTHRTGGRLLAATDLPVPLPVPMPTQASFVFGQMTDFDFSFGVHPQ